MQNQSYRRGRPLLETKSGKEIGVRGRFNSTSKRAIDSWKHSEVKVPFKLYVDNNEQANIGLSDKSSLIFTSMVTYIAGIMFIAYPVMFLINLILA